MPKDTPEELAAKQEAIQRALVGATEVPLDIMRAVARVIDHADYLAHHGSRMARSDAGFSAAFARAAVDGASLNVYINTASMDDPARALRVREEASAIASMTRERCDELFDFCGQRGFIGKGPQGLRCIMATLLKGKPVVDHMAVDLRSRIETLKSRGVEPHARARAHGERPDDLSYERTAKKRAASLGLATKPYVLTTWRRRLLCKRRCNPSTTTRPCMAA